jgi:branched-chain amino acid transport system substrate-binding protein
VDYLKIGVTFFILFIFIFFSGCKYKDSIKIGVIYNLEGDAQPLDISSIKGAKLACKQINAAGGIKDRKLKLLFYASQKDPHTIIQNKKVLGFVSFSDRAMALAAASLAMAAKTAFITVGPTPAHLQASAGAAYAYEQLKLKTAYLLYHKEQEASQVLAQKFKESYEQLGGKIVLEEIYQEDAQNLTLQIESFKALRNTPDMLYIAARSKDIGQIIKDFRQQGIYEPILGGDSYDTPLLIQVAQENANNVYYTTPAFMNDELGTPQIQKFMSEYRQEYDMYPQDAAAILGYDAIMILAEAFKKAEKLDRPSVLDVVGSDQSSQSVSIISIKKGHLSLEKEGIKYEFF